MSAPACVIASDNEADAADAQNIEKNAAYARKAANKAAENIAAQSRAYARTCRRLPQAGKAGRT